MSENEWRPNRSGPWAAVDAGLLRHPKLRTVGPTAKLLYVAGLLHCADELTDGYVDVEALPGLYREVGNARRRNVEELEDAGLWIRCEKPARSQREASEKPASSQRAGHGWQVHGYLDWNPPRAWWEHQRRRNAAKQAAWRERVTSVA